MDRIYVDITDDKTAFYRWNGAQYRTTESNLVLGNSSSTAFPGDLGLQAYNHAIGSHYRIMDEENNFFVVTEDTKASIVRNTVNRVLVDDDKTELRPPSGSGFAKVINGEYSYNDGLYIRESITSENNRSFSPDGTTRTTLYNGGYHVYDGSQLRFRTGTSDSVLISPAGGNELLVTEAGIYYNEAEVLTVNTIAGPRGSYMFNGTGTIYMTKDHINSNPIIVVTDNSSVTLNLPSDTFGTSRYFTVINLGTGTPHVQSPAGYSINGNGGSVVALKQNIPYNFYIAGDGATKDWKCHDHKSWMIRSTDDSNYVACYDTGTRVNGGLIVDGDVEVDGLFKAVNSGAGLRVQQSDANQSTIIDYFKEDGTTRKGWVGFGSSGNRSRMTIWNDNDDGEIYITPKNGINDGQVVVDGLVKANGFLSSDGTAGISGTYDAGVQSRIIVKNGLVVSIA